MTSLIGLFGALQSLVLALAVISMGGSERQPNRALGLMLLVLAVAVFAVSVEHGGLFGGSIAWVLLEYTASLLFPPALWHYAATVLGRRRRIPIVVHLLPALAWIAYLLAFTLGWTQWRWLPPVMGLVAYSMLYTAAVGVQAWASAARSRSLVSHVLVLRAVVVALVVLHAAQWLRFAFRDVDALKDAVPVTATAIVVTLSMLAFRQSRLFAAAEPSATDDKYASSTLTPDRGTELRQRLLRVMDRDKPYLNENLNLADLAARLKIPRAHLSQVVNAEMGSNFADLLSRYRVDEAERLLGDSRWKHLTVEAIGYEVGFRSRSAFHSAFKRLRGETPAASRKRMS